MAKRRTKSSGQPALNSKEPLPTPTPPPNPGPSKPSTPTFKTDQQFNDGQQASSESTPCSATAWDNLLRLIGESGLTENPNSIKVVNRSTIQIQTSPGAVRYSRSDDGTYCYSRFALGGTGGGESSALHIAEYLFDRCRTTSVVHLLQQLGWTDVIDHYRAIESQASSSQSRAERFQPPAPPSVRKDVELSKESFLDEDQEEEEQEYYNEVEARRQELMDKSLDALLARAALNDKQLEKDEIIVEDMEIDQVDGPLVKWCGLRDLWFKSDLSEESFLSSVIDWCPSAYIQREEWDGGAPGMSGHMITVTTDNPGKLLREIAERIRELHEERPYRNRP